jgi:hypothetical protein
MESRNIKRVNRELTDGERMRLTKYREQVAKELPDLRVRDQMRKQAREEATLSGEIRRSIHSSPLSLSEIAVRSGLTPALLDGFLTGEMTLRSDVLDRLTSTLGYELTKAS